MVCVKCDRCIDLDREREVANWAAVHLGFELPVGFAQGPRGAEHASHWQCLMALGWFRSPEDGREVGWHARPKEPRPMPVHLRSAPKPGQSFWDVYGSLF